MEQAKIDKINFLAKQSKSRPLTPQELDEQAALRKEYINAIRENFKKTLDSIEYIDNSAGTAVRKK